MFIKANAQTVIEALAITTDRLANGSFGQDYKQVLTAEKGAEPYRWRLLSSVPKGLLLSSDGVILGRPSEVGQWTVIIQVRDNEGRTEAKQLPLFVGPDRPVITTKGLPDAELTSNYSAQLEVSGGVGPFQWSIQKGTLPSGLLLDPALGAIKGTPDALGTSELTIQVLDHLNRPDQRTFVIDIRRPPNEVLGSLWRMAERVLVRFIAPLLVVFVVPVILLIGIIVFVVQSGEKIRSLFGAFVPLIIGIITLQFQSEIWGMFNHIPWLVGLISGLIIGFVVMWIIKVVRASSPDIPVAEFVLSVVFCFFIFSAMVLRESSPFAIYYGTTLGAMIHAWILGWA